MKTSQRLFVACHILLILLLGLPPVWHVWADVAPPRQPPGSNIDPGAETQVQMVAETVLLDASALADWAGTIQVTAVFTMHNRGSRAEPLQVRFPVEYPRGGGDGYGRRPEISGCTVEVSGLPVPTQTIHEPFKPGDEAIDWAAFDVVFPPGQDITIRVTYATSPTLAMDQWGQLHYVLETGSGWHGPIGAADLILRLPYAASPENVILSSYYWTSTGAQFTGNEVRWHLQDFEPQDWRDDFRITIVWPDVWRDILSLQATVEADPHDPAALSELADHRMEAYSEKHGFVLEPYLGDLVEDPLEAAVENHPDSADLHAKLAAVRLWRALPNVDADALEAIVGEINAALALDPQNAQALEVEEALVSWGLTTATPGPSPTRTVVPPSPRATPMATRSAQPPTTRPSLTPPTVAPMPTLTSTPTPVQPPGSAPDSSGVLPWLGAFVLVAGAAVLLITYAHRRR